MSCRARAIPAGVAVPYDRQDGAVRQVKSQREADLQAAVAAARRRRMRAKFFLQLADVLVRQGQQVPGEAAAARLPDPAQGPRPGQLEEVPDAPGQRAARRG